MSPDGAGLRNVYVRKAEEVLFKLNEGRITQIPSLRMSPSTNKTDLDDPFAR